MALSEVLQSVHAAYMEVMQFVYVVHMEVMQCLVRAGDAIYLFARLPKGA